MRTKLHTASFFYLPYLVILLIGLTYFLYNEQGDFVLLLNDLHHPILNTFFKYWTYTGDWFFISIVTLIVLFFRFRYGLILTLVGIVQGAITYVLKYLVFQDTVRPKGYFEGKQVLDLIEGVKIQDFNSFPSGHTMAIFALVTFLILMFQNKRTSILLLLVGITTAISRIYLSQHFLIDIIVGSLIGVIVATILYLVFEKYLEQSNNDDKDPSDDLSMMDLDITDVN